MLKKPENPFEAEKMRDKLAAAGRIEDFKKTYNSRYPEVKDLNSPRFWDKLNTREHISWEDSPMTVHKLNLINGFLPDKKIKVLNIGCGSGDLENVVFNIKRKSGIDWTGVDISPKSIKKCKKEFPDARFSVGDILKLKLKKEKFDFIILMEILEHIRPSEIFKALKTVKRVLKRKGRLIVSVPINEGLEEMLKNGENPNAHVRTYTPEIITTELEISGFEVIKVKQLTAFKRFYRLKTFISEYLIKGLKQPNNLVILAVKKK